MKVILNEDVTNLGEEGDIKIVKHGYARNFLIPRGLALPFTKGNAKIFEARKEIIEKKKEEKRKAALGIREKIESLELTIPMPAGDSGRLFGSVNNAVICDYLAKEGIVIERKRIELAEHTVKMIGKYTARVRLYENHNAQLAFTIVDEKGGSAADKPASKPAESVEAAADSKEQTVAAASEDAVADEAIQDNVTEDQKAEADRE